MTSAARLLVPGPSRRRPVAPAALLGALLALAALLGAPAPALAHDRLVSSDPADGATVATAPAAITLTFSDDILDVSPVVRVTAQDGTVVVEAAPRVEGTTATLDLPDGLPTGTAAVQWRVVSADGHPIEGDFSFTVEQGSAPAATTETPASEAPTEAGTTGATPTPSASPSASPSSAASGSETTGGGLGAGALGVILGAIVVVLVVGGILLARRGRGSAR
ncbi:copper resistance CopC family protein [Brachybacterium huguangmaarense]